MIGGWIASAGANADVKLLASFKPPSDIILRRELWSLRSPRLNAALTLTSDCRGTEFGIGVRARLSAEMLSVGPPDLPEGRTFLCGPESFADPVPKVFPAKGFELARLHSKSSGSGHSAHGSKGRSRTQGLKGTTHKATFLHSGVV